jgi:hypothetical protein
LGDKRPVVFAGDNAGEHGAAAGHRQGNRRAAAHFQCAVDSRLSASPGLGERGDRQIERRTQLNFYRRRRVLLLATASTLISQVIEVLDVVVEAPLALLASNLLLKVVANLRGVATDEVAAAGADALLSETAGVAKAHSALLIAEPAHAGAEAAAAENGLTEAAAAEAAGPKPTAPKGATPEPASAAAAPADAAASAKASVAKVAAAEPALLIATLELGMDRLGQHGDQEAAR